MHAHDILTLCGLATAGFACQWLAWRLKLPAILFLLGAGIVAGPVLGWLDPDALFGDLLTPIVSVAVAIILFEGSLTLKLSEIRDHGSVVRNLVTVGVVITWALAGLAAWYFLDWDPYLAALFGAVVTVSGPTVVMPLLRAVRTVSNVSSILRWESILIDPLGAILALLVFDVIISMQAGAGFGHIAVNVAAIALIGTILGVAGGYLFGIAVRKRVIPDLLRDYAALAAVLTVFAVAEVLRSESGFLAVTIMGVWLANMRHVELEDILDFKESITLLLLGALFILLAAKLDITEMTLIGSGALAVIALLQLVAGPIRAFVSAIGSPLNWRETLYVGWVFPRGIVAAAVSSLFALRLVEIDYPGANSLVPLVFTVIIGTVVLQSITAKLVARALGVLEPEPTGVLIVGSNPLARLLAKAIQDSGRRVRVADSHYAGIREARMMGLPVFYGSPVSSYAERGLDITGLGTLIAASRRPGLNELACVRFTADFGRDHVFVLGRRLEKSHEKHSISGAVSGRILFGGEHTIDDLASRVASGQAIKSTELTDEFGFDDYRKQNPNSLILFAIDDNDQLKFPLKDEPFDPAAGWTITALV
ncbi:MAG: sodium:proton antiporter [Gammaproteobacteria bacterium]|nr:sodium:proton antiporter [Gammaproteobacteria bacterium]